MILAVTIASWLWGRSKRYHSPFDEASYKEFPNSLQLFLVSRTLVARDSCHFWTSQSRQVRSGLLLYGLGWGGVGWSLNLNTWWMLRNCVCLVTAHMVDATQLCLSCHCTPRRCYATVFILNLHVGWGGDDDILWTWTHGGCYATVFVLSLHTWWMLRNCVCLVIAHLVDATQLCLSWTCTWGGVGMMTFFELEHMVDATQLCLSCHCTHGGCYATVFVLSLHTS